jgi:molecular chaperone DnaK
MGKVVGIDLGTTYSAIAVVNNHGRSEILSNREGDRITPSVILFEGGVPIIGNMAKRAAIANPLNFVQFVKRQMGNSSWKFRTEEDEEFTPEELSALIIKRLKEDAEIMLDEKITDAVITVPAYFDDAQRKSTQDAGKIAGLNVLRIINEPTAAALSYGIDKVNEKQTVLVYDLGGGTFDVTIMQVDKNKINVIATGGDKNLGGFDWDNALMVHLNEEFVNQGGPDLFDDPSLEQDLRDKSEIAKKTLSTPGMEKTKVFLSAGGLNAQINLTLSDFESLTESLLSRTERIMMFVLEDAKLEWKDIDKILLVGGSTRMKAVSSLVNEVTGKKPSMEVHPDEVVAMGAALQGALLEIADGKSDLVEKKDFPLVEIKDVCSHSLGVVSIDERGEDINSIVLRKDTQLPCKVSDIFSTVIDNQTKLKVQVTQGEDTDVNYITIIGESLMTIPPYPKGSPIEVFFEYDNDGLIHVSVFDLTAQKSLGEMKIGRKANLSEEEITNKLNKIMNMNVS